jgi:CheY-like chemotaxis protein
MARVLVADDEPMTAEMFALMLAFRGYETVCARDGAEALLRARELKPDVVLMDVIMPGMEGEEVTRLLRRDPSLAACRIVLFSSADEAEVAWREAGADLFLQKPVDLRLLPELVSALLQAERPAADGIVA